MPNIILSAGAKRLPDTARHTDRIRINSDSTPGQTYVVAFDRNLRRYVCGCCSFVYGKGRPCKHLLRLGMVGNRAPEPTPAPRRTKRRKARKPTVKIVIPAMEWAPEDIAAAALEFAE